MIFENSNSTKGSRWKFQYFFPLCPQFLSSRGNHREILWMYYLSLSTASTFLGGGGEGGEEPCFFKMVGKSHPVKKFSSHIILHKALKNLNLYPVCAHTPLNTHTSLPLTAFFSHCSPPYFSLGTLPSLWFSHTPNKFLPQGIVLANPFACILFLPRYL